MEDKDFNQLMDSLMWVKADMKTRTFNDYKKQRIKRPKFLFWYLFYTIELRIEMFINKMKG